MKSPTEKIPEPIRIPLLVGIGVVSMMLFVCCGGCTMFFWSRGAPRPAVASNVSDAPSEEFDQIVRLAEEMITARQRAVDSGQTILDPVTMKAGTAGQIRRPVKVVQSLGNGSFLGEVGYPLGRGTIVVVLFHGVDDADLVDDRYWLTDGRWFYVLGPESYETVTGARRTVIAVAEIAPPPAEPGM